MRDAFRKLGAKYGLVDDDIKSTSMGVNGVDVQFSPAAARVLGPIAVECKNVESLQVVPVFQEHEAKYGSEHYTALFHKKNRTEPMVTIRMKDFMTFFSAWVGARQ